MKKVIINAFGPDKTGLVYEISKIILSLKWLINLVKL